MEFKVEAVSPDAAKEFLSRSIGNRPCRRTRLEKYCRARRNGQWVLTHQGLAFDTKEHFIDGHHRCEMVIETGMTTDFLVVRQVNPDAAKYIDQGLPRSSRDALAMAGMGDYTQVFMSIAKGYKIAPAMRNDDATTDDLLEVIEENAEAITFSADLFRSRTVGVTRAVKILVARAWIYGACERLKEFAVVLATGQPFDAEADRAAIAYRNFLLSFSRSNGPTMEEEKYRKGQTALDAFLHRKPITKVYGTEKDLFPLKEAD